MVRQAGAEEWVEASELDLASLTGFLTDPLQILESCQEQFSSAYAGETVELGEMRCRTVYLKPENYAALITGLFPEIDRAAIREITLGRPHRNRFGNKATAPARCPGGDRKEDRARLLC